MENTPRVGVRWPTARVTRGADHVAIDLDLAGSRPTSSTSRPPAPT